MPVEVRMPSLGMTMEEGRVVSWLVREGDRVSPGQTLVEIESEKVAYEVESPAAGVVGSILVAADATVPVGTPLVLILDADELATGGASRAAATPPPADAVTAVAARSPERGAPTNLPVARSAGPAAPRPSPRARKLADELGVDLAKVSGTGPGGTIVEQDIRAAAAHAGPAPAPAGLADERGEAPFTLRALTSMRRTIAERMAASAREAPHFFLAVEADGGALRDYRRVHGPRLAQETGVSLTVTDLLVWCVARTLAAHPALNASYAPEGIRVWGEINLGLAVAVDDGLIAPVIRHADRQSLPALMTTRADLVERARARTLGADDLRGGTFTISNLGSFGIDFFTSILNPSQAAILSVGALRERPAVVDGQVVARPSLMLGLTIDHRVTDGAAGARFLGDLRARLETPGLRE